MTVKSAIALFEIVVFPIEKVIHNNFGQKVK
jgi:hypothetical protein